MALQSRLPGNLTDAQRLREYVDLLRFMSTVRDPQDFVTTYRAKAQVVSPFDHSLTLSRRGMPPGQLRITRSTRWAEEIDPWKSPHRLPVVDRGMLVRLLEAATPIKIDRLEVEADDPFAPYAQGMRSLMAAPNFAGGEPLYMVILLDAAPEAYTLQQLANFTLISNLVSMTTSQLLSATELRRAYQLLNNEFLAVGEIQRQLLPSEPPIIPGVTIATSYETSTHAGGDYYNIFPVGERWGFLIADVSGHGPAAAVVMAMLHAFLRAPLRHCPEQELTADKLLGVLNDELLSVVRPSQFVTAFLGLYDPRQRTLTYASAGHNPPRLLRQAQEVIPLHVEPGLPLAIISPYEAFEACLRIEPGDRVILYTDGISETFNPQGEMFGSDGIDSALRCCSHTPEALIGALREAVVAHSRGAAPEDDRTLLAIAFD